MSRKTFVIAIVVVGCCTRLMAQDKQSEPFLGIWEINLTKTVNYPQQGQMIINVPTPGGGFISTRDRWRFMRRGVNLRRPCCSQVRAHNDRRDVHHPPA